ncbi:MAG TPA: hypothetical protein VIQ31_03860 [Phormidium sp.]
MTSITLSQNQAVSAILALSAYTGFERFPAGQLTLHAPPLLGNEKIDRCYDVR